MPVCRFPDGSLGCNARVRLQLKKQGRDFIRVPVSQNYLAIIRFLAADCGVVGEMQVVGAWPIKVDPTLNHITVTRTDSHC